MKKILLIGLMLMTTTSLFAGEDMYAAFVKFDGVPGEALASGTPGWNRVSSMKLGKLAATGNISNPVASFIPSKIVFPKTNNLGALADMSMELTKWLDKSSPDLLSLFRGRNRITDAKLCLCSAANPGEVLLTYELKNVMVTGFKQQGNQEKLTLNFEIIEFKKSR